MGLGWSSAFAVGVSQALSALDDLQPDKHYLASFAARLEVDILKRAIGKQDHYASAFGGLNYLQFHSDESVVVTPLGTAGVFGRLESCLLLYNTGRSRDAEHVLREQWRNTQSSADSRSVLAEMVQLADALRTEVHRIDAEKLWRFLSRDWELKKKLATNVTTAAIDSWCQIALEAGASGAKLLGAGRAGFLLVAADQPAAARVDEALAAVSLRRLPFKIVSEGSQVVYAE
jgi:D-glycero-alpha-D-manno-heptose-7-phosphate kinase